MSVNKEKSLDKSPKMIEKFLETQLQEIEIRRKELELRSKEIEFNKQQYSNDYEYSKLSLEAQAKDRQEIREYSQGVIKKIINSVVIIITLIVILLGLAIWSGEAELALKLVEWGVLISVSVFGGYSWGKRKSGNSDN